MVLRQSLGALANVAEDLHVCLEQKYCFTRSTKRNLLESFNFRTGALANIRRLRRRIKVLRVNMDGLLWSNVNNTCYNGCNACYTLKR